MQQPSNLTVDALARAEAQLWTDQGLGSFSRWRTRADGWHIPQQKNPYSHQPAIPPELIAETNLSTSEIHLSSSLDLISGHTGAKRYWLRGFDPIFYAGRAIYERLRCTSQLQDLARIESLVSSSRDLDQEGVAQLIDAFSAVCGRITSWTGDEAICLAIILDKDVSKVVNAEPSDRMEVLVRMCEVVPRGIIFIEAPPDDPTGLALDA
jgi:hypothetical protein